MTKLFVGGFPLDITELDLVQHLSFHGEIVTIKIVRDKKTRKCKGYAFIEVSSNKDADQIIKALDGTEFGGRELTINIVAEPEKPKITPSQNYRPGGSPPNQNPVRAKRPRKTFN